MSPVRLVARIVRTVLTRGEKLRVALLGALVLANVGLEMLGLGLFIPTLALLTSDDAVADLRSGFAPLADMSDGAIVEDAEPEEFFNNPKSDRAKDFLGKILNH